MSTKKALIMGGALALAIPAVLLFAGFRFQAGFRHHRDPEMMAKFIQWRINEKLDSVKATNAQKQQIQAIEDRLVNEAKTLHQENRGFRQAILKELQQDTPDAAKIHALVDARATSMKAFADKLTDGVLEAHAVLTPEQRSQLFQQMHQHFENE